MSSRLLREVDSEGPIYTRLYGSTFTGLAIYRQLSTLFLVLD